MKLPVNEFKAALGRREAQIGLWVASPTPMLAEVVATAGFDWLPSTASTPPTTCAACSRSCRRSRPIRSARSCGRWRARSALIKQYLDIGAQTLLVPMVDTAEQAALMVARDALSAARHARLGARWHALRAGTSRRLLRARGRGDVRAGAGRAGARYRQPGGDRRCRRRRRRLLRPRPICRRRWAFSATPGIPTCCARSTTASPRFSPRARRRASSRRTQSSRAAISQPARCSSRSGSTRCSWRAVRARALSGAIAGAGLTPTDRLVGDASRWRVGAGAELVHRSRTTR